MTVESNNLQKAGSNTESNKYSKYHPYRITDISVSNFDISLRMVKKNGKKSLKDKPFLKQSHHWVPNFGDVPNLAVLMK